MESINRDNTAFGNQTSRIPFWDTAKALLIFLVILGHVVQYFICAGINHWDDCVFKSIYSFHMPLFMLISGFFAEKSIRKHGWNTLIRYFYRLALPCISMGVILMLSDLYRGTFESLSFKYLYDRCFSLWYLVVVYECIVFYVLMNMKESWVYRLFLFFAAIVGAVAIKKIPYLYLLMPHSAMFSFFWPFFVMGAYLSRGRFNADCISLRWCVLSVFYIILYFIFQPTWYVYWTPLGFSWSTLFVDMMRTVTAICGCGTFLLLCKYLPRRVGNIPLVSRIGQSTLAIYALQHFFFYQTFEFRLHNYWAGILVALALLFFLYGFYEVSRRVPVIAPLLYGERTSSRRN